MKELSITKLGTSLARIVFTVICLANTAAFANAKELSGSVDLIEGNDEKIPLNFRAAFNTEIHTRFMHVGDKFEAHLVNDLICDEQLIAPAKSKIIGHVAQLTESKPIAKAMLSKTDRFRKRSSIVLQFDRIIKPDKTELSIRGLPIRQIAIFNNHGHPREVVVAEGGLVKKATDLELIGTPIDDVLVPESLLDIGDRFQVKLIPGDQLVVRATVMREDLASQSVLGRVMPRNKYSQRQVSQTGSIQ
ncbi:MAG: hypothetical protein K2X29_06520 [Candidatus Obscuribacterales bacterium]|nr:hypothetical protein [Candidatus Obscuribacterales bacterium]